MNGILLLLFIIIQNFSPAKSSDGDRSPFYQTCVKNCLGANCTKDGVSFTSSTAALQDGWSRTLGWSCRDECRYHCMWRTVQAFMERGYPVPKFHGKWPFERLFGVQEPASVLCSLLNMAAHAYMWWRLRRDGRFSVRDTPLLLFWHLFFAVCIHAWSWSVIFHARDTPFTEFMDYACALSMVMALFVAAVVRVFLARRGVAALIVLCTLLYFTEHARYLHRGRVDYDFNMTVNVCFGMMASLTWVTWSLAHWQRTGPRARYVWRLVLFNKLSGAALLLELFDFAPLWRAWDAHAFWHLSTAPLPLLFYKFVIDDLDYLETIKLSEKTDLKIA